MTKTAGQGQGQERNDIPAPPTQKWLTVKDSVVGKVLEENYLFDFLTLLFFKVIQKWKSSNGRTIPEFHFSISIGFPNIVMWQCPLSSGPQCKIRVQSAQMWSYFYKKVAFLISNDKKRVNKLNCFRYYLISHDISAHQSVKLKYNCRRCNLVCFKLCHLFHNFFDLQNINPDFDFIKSLRIG